MQGGICFNRYPSHRHVLIKKNNRVKYTLMVGFEMTFRIPISSKSLFAYITNPPWMFKQ
jgi:hypothetical protein